MKSQDMLCCITFYLFRYDGYYGPPLMGPPRGRRGTGMRPGRGNYVRTFPSIGV